MFVTPVQRDLLLTSSNLISRRRTRRMFESETEGEALRASDRSAMASSRFIQFTCGSPAAIVVERFHHSGS
jgi:hypothetical protein